jgi:hypothetical protein
VQEHYLGSVPQLDDINIQEIKDHPGLQLPEQFTQVRTVLGYLAKFKRTSNNHRTDVSIFSEIKEIAISNLIWYCDAPWSTPPLSFSRLFPGDAPSQSCPTLKVPDASPLESSIRESIIESPAAICKQPTPFLKNDLKEVYNHLTSLQIKFTDVLTPKLSVRFDYYKVYNSPFWIPSDPLLAYMYQACLAIRLVSLSPVGKLLFDSSNTFLQRCLSPADC